MKLVTYSAHGRTCVGELDDERVYELEAANMLDWLNGRGRERTGASNAAADVALRAPVPEPPSLRDFFAFEGHVAAGARLRGGSGPEHRDKAPALYFSKPASVGGAGAPGGPPAGAH